MPTDKHYVHDSLIHTLRMRDALADGGEESACAAAQALADELWKLTRPAKAAKTPSWAPPDPEGVARPDPPTAPSEDVDDPFAGL